MTVRQWVTQAHRNHHSNTNALYGAHNFLSNEFKQDDKTCFTFCEQNVSSACPSKTHQHDARVLWIVARVLLCSY